MTLLRFCSISRRISFSFSLLRAVHRAALSRLRCFRASVMCRRRASFDSTALAVVSLTGHGTDGGAGAIGRIPAQVTEGDADIASRAGGVRTGCRDEVFCGAGGWVARFVRLGGTRSW